MLVILSLLLAAGAQLLSLIDPLIFGHIIDQFASPKHVLAENKMVSGILLWLLLALGIALFSKLLKSLQDYFTRKTVALFGMQVFNDGLKQTLRLSFQEIEESRS